MLDSRLGKWLSVDPLASEFAGTSPYEFCLNNPVILIDPDGMKPEEPVILLSKRDKANAVINEAANNYPYKKGDGIFTVFAHANSSTLQYVDENEVSHFISTAAQFDELMKEKSAAYKEARESGKKIMVVLMACDAGVDQVSMPGGKITPVKSIGQIISDEIPNVTVAAPDGPVKSQKSVDIIDNKVVVSEKAKVLGVEKKTNDGGFNIFKKGVKVAKIEYKTKPHNNTPEVGKTKIFSKAKDN